jgi:glycosyltransferase involved in cell wall biosynthesis
MIGPKKFLLRLNPFIESCDFKIVNPDKAGFLTLLKSYFSFKKSVIILRCDGVNFVRLSDENIGAFCESRNWKFKRFLKFTVIIFGLNKASVLFNLWLNRYSIFSYLLAKKIVFQSNLSKQMYSNFIPFYTELKNSVIINNGIGNITVNNYKLNHKFFSICISANPFRPHKRLLDAISIVSELILLCPSLKFRLVVLGRVPEKFYGVLDRFMYIEHYTVLNDYDYLIKLSECHILLSLALFDPCPNVVVEALSLGLPVVTPEQSGAFELINCNYDWSVNEEYELNYCDFQSQSFVAIKPEKREIYLKKIIKIIGNYEYHSQLALNFSERLKIEKIADEYIEFAKS